MKPSISHSLVIAVTMAFAFPSSACNRPNVILAMSDDMGWMDLSSYGNDRVATPHIDRLSKEGIKLTQYYAASAVCTPTRASAQIDLLLDRPDNTINIVEIKFSQTPFTINKSYASELRNKIGTFRGVTSSRKNLFLTLLTTYGLSENTYAKELVQESFTTDALFTDVS